MSAQRKLRAVSACMMAFVLFMGVVAVIPQQVKADYLYSISYATAQYGDLWIVKGKFKLQLGAPEVTEFWDGDMYEVWIASDDYCYIFTTTNFTDGYLGTMPPLGVDITWVMVTLYGLNQYPDTYLKYEVEGGGANTSSNFNGYNYYMNWDITSLEDWTPEMFQGTNFTVQAWVYPEYNTPIYIDYIGVSIAYRSEDEIEEGEEGDPEENEYGGADVGWDIIYGEGLIGTLGFVGLIGMIAVPGLAVYVHRHGDQGNIQLFVSMLMIFMFCLTLFLYSINAG